MAHLECYTKTDMAKITREAFREQNETAYKNRVDKTRSHLNYTIGCKSRNELLTAIDLRCLQVLGADGVKRMQSQTNVVGSWVITLPEQLKTATSIEQRNFFNSVYKFNQERYGMDNVVGGVVHYDETTPHITVYVVPACKSRKTGKQTISSASLFTRSELKQYHTDLEKYLQGEFGMKGLALNGRTKGGYTIEELKKRNEDAKKIQKLAKDYKYYAEQLEVKQSELNEREQKLNARDNALRAAETALNNRERDFNEKAAKRLAFDNKRAESLSEREKAIFQAEQEKDEIKQMRVKYNKHQEQMMVYVKKGVRLGTGELKQTGSPVQMTIAQFNEYLEEDEKEYQQREKQKWDALKKQFTEKCINPYPQDDYNL